MSISKEIAMKAITLQYNQARSAVGYMAAATTYRPEDLTIALGILDTARDLVRTALDTADQP